MLQKQTALCLGLDPRLENIPAHLLNAHRTNRSDRCDTDRRAAACVVYDFCAAVVEAVAPHVAAVKLQMACFEQYGAPGMRAFKFTCDRAAELDLMVIADGKRGDIGISAEAYSAAYLGSPTCIDASLEPSHVDALTVNPLFGTDGVTPFLKDCQRHGKGIFVLVKTSNPSSAELQDLIIAGNDSFHEQVASLVAEWGAGEGLVGEKGYSSVGAVVGATHPETMARLRKLLPRAIFLVPGVGAQGAKPAETAAAFDSRGLGALITVSRSIIYAGDGRDYAMQAAAAAKRIKSELRVVSQK
jgi:orotidine-5'-phosphate decarboxylase